ncbi:MFS transporter [Cellulomonas composti]|uniref:MFS transporter n=1 Tax=Cellulomonas composti TaxID=266130 RepID=UPI001FE9BD38|nr:MFS transporter [Cellulomonas composti]
MTPPSPPEAESATAPDPARARDDRSPSDDPNSHGLTDQELPDHESVDHRSLVHHRDFRWLWGGDALGQLGAQLTMLALPIYAVQHLHASEWQMGTLTAAETAAFLVIGLPAGAWVDRMRKRRVLIVADLVRALVLGFVVVAAFAGFASVPLLVVAAAAISTASVFFDVAHQSYVPGLVGLEHVVEGNSKLQATQSVAQVAAPAIGGALLRVIAAPALIAVNVVTYLISAFAVGRIAHREEPPAPETRRPMRTEIAEGLRFVVHQPILRRIVATTSLSNLGSSISGAVLVIYALRTLGLDAAAFGTLVSASAVGGLVGAFTAARLSRLVGEARIIPVSAIGFAVGGVFFPLAAVVTVPAQVVLVVGGVILYFFVIVYNVAQVSFRQRLCPPALLGRMNASVRFIVWGSMPIGALLGGWLGTHLGVTATMWVSVGVGALATLPVLISPLLRMERLPSPPAPQPSETGPSDKLSRSREPAPSDKPSGSREPGPSDEPSGSREPGPTD